MQEQPFMQKTPVWVEEHKQNLSIKPDIVNSQSRVWVKISWQSC